MNSLTWKPLTHNNPFTLRAGEGIILMPENDRAVISLPPSPHPGDIVGIMDAGGTFDTQPITINPNDNRINNTDTDAYIFNVTGSVIQLIYTGPIYGWMLSSALQTEPFAKALVFPVSDFCLDSVTLTDEYFIWLLNPVTTSKHAQLPPLNGNKGLYFILINVSQADIALRPYSGDKIVGIEGDYTILTQSAIHIASTSETEELGWVLTSKSSLT